jgi:hypothetical protein
LLFVEDENIDLANVVAGSVKFGDYDNDGDLDIFLSGFSDSDSEKIAKIYQNKDGIFTEDTNIMLTGVVFKLSGFRRLRQRWRSRYLHYR